MNTIFYHPTVRGLLSLWLLFICFSLVWALMQLLQQKRYKLIAPALVFFAGCDIYWQYLNAYSFFIGTNKEYYKIDYAPIWLIVVINAVLTVAAFGFVYHIYRWGKSHITAVSVKESFDTLESGICFFEDSGRLYLVNDVMDKLTQKLVGQHLYNGERLWKILKENSAELDDDNRAVVEIERKTYSFSRYKNTVNGQELYEIIASDITGEAAQNRQLEIKNADLEQLNAALEEYNKNLENIVREREILQSKAKIHDDMNVLLVSTVNSIENYDEAESKHISRMWNEGILELQKDTEEYRKNPLETLNNLADSLGVKLVFEGSFPENNATLRLLIMAVSESMINAVRHANATAIFVSSDEFGFEVTNNGAPPVSEVKAAGGLNNLRERANSLGAALTVESFPRFVLKIKY